MSLLLWCLLFPAVALCGLKLSLTHNPWEFLPSALLLAAIPIGLHPFIIRASLVEINRLMQSSEILTTFSTALALESIFSLLLVSAVMRTHAGAAASLDNTHQGRYRTAYGMVAAFITISLLVGCFSGSKIVLSILLLAFAGVAAWPWRPYAASISTYTPQGRGFSPSIRSLLTLSLWSLLSPAGFLVIAGVHLQWLHRAAGMDLWRLTILYAGALFFGIALTTLGFRLILRSWQARLGGVMALAFLLLMVAMFLPQLISSAPPPASSVQASWSDTALFAALVLPVFAIAHYRSRKKDGGKNKKGISSCPC